MSRQLKKSLALIYVVCLVTSLLGTAYLVSATDDTDDQIIDSGYQSQETDVQRQEQDLYPDVNPDEHNADWPDESQPDLEQQQTDLEPPPDADTLQPDVVEQQPDTLNAYQQTEAGIPIYIDGILSMYGLLYNCTAYVPLRAFCETVYPSSVVTWDQATTTATVTADNFVLTVSAGDNFFSANDRYFYLPDGVLTDYDRIVLPVRALAVCLNLEITWNPEDISVNVGTSATTPLEYAETFYGEEDLYWLSRIIFCESGNQSLEGMIGVGNVVVNRVNDPTCPDTIYDVIFDTRHGIQFSPVAAGTIYGDPSAMAVIAAKIVLEGYNIAEDSIFFVNPQIGSTGWFYSSRTYVMTIGDHAFYS